MFHISHTYIHIYIYIILYTHIFNNIRIHNMCTHMYLYIYISIYILYTWILDVPWKENIRTLSPKRLVVVFGILQNQMIVFFNVCFFRSMIDTKSTSGQICVFLLGLQKYSWFNPANHVEHIAIRASLSKQSLRRRTPGQVQGKRGETTWILHQHVGLSGDKFQHLNGSC